MASAQEVVSYWLGASVEGPEGAASERERWYRGGGVVDTEIRERFGDDVARARAGRLSAWESSPESPFQ